MMGLWKSFPPEVIEKHLSSQGAAFRMSYSFPGGDPKNRFWFVLNRQPDKDTEIILATTSTQIAARRSVRRSCPGVLVFIGPKDYPPLDTGSVIDCASIEQTTFQKQYLLERASRKDIQPLDSLPPEALQRILDAVRSARLLPPRLKTLILGGEEDNGAASE